MNNKLLLFLLCFFPVSGFPQGPLTPPAAPTPTMKTLDQVEPRKPINATNTPGDANSVFKITTSGSYYLTGNVTGVSGKNGISIAASNVTIDLKGFTLGGVGSSLDGVHVESGNTRLTVRNGTITSWGGDGVDEIDGGATDGIYENIRATGNSADGLRLNEKCVVTACKLDHNSGSGMSCGGRATIKNCTANDNVLLGFYFGAGSILDSIASSNGGNGIESFDEPVLIKNCVVFESGDTGIRSGGGGKIADCISRLNNFAGIDTGYYATVTNCTVKNNGIGIFVGGFSQIVGNMGEGNGDGISTYDDQNVIDGNQMANGGTGIHVMSGSIHNLIIRNRVSHDPANPATNYDIAADNHYGPIVDLTGTGTPAVSGSSAADTTTTSHPWANFSF